MRSIFRLFLICLVVACKSERSGDKANTNVRGLIADTAMVVSAREEASNIGLEIMRQGGNAYDAAIAVELALAVSYPYAGNLGGGGFLVYRTQYGELGSIDFREKAPIKASRDMYLDADGNYLSDKSKNGALAAGVPGTIAGLFAIHEKLGTLPMELLIQPAIDLAAGGFIVTRKQAENFAKYGDNITEVTGEPTVYSPITKEGDRIVNKALANTLERLSTNGLADFYQGETARILVEQIQNRGGIITMDDLAAYDTEWREPLVFTYDDLTIISMAPPSSGGICLAQMLKMVEPFPIETYDHNSKKYIQLLSEVERRAYADRSYFLGDPDFVDIPVDSLMDMRYLRERMADFSFDAVTPSSTIKPGTIQIYEGTETTHFSIVDPLGNAASLTTTLNSAFGSKLYIKELGFFLNNEMDDFSAKPGEPNIYGLVGGEFNAIAPQKRMLSSMTPTIIEKEGKLWMVLGTPGGATIMTSVFQTILNVHEFKMHMQQAVNVPRFHHQWLPDAIRYEAGAFPRNLIDEMASLGYPENLEVDPIIGKVDAILVLPDGRLEAGADPRGDDKAAGF